LESLEGGDEEVDREELLVVWRGMGGEGKGVDESTYNDFKKSSSPIDTLHYQPPLFIKSAYEPKMH
jgi:hypothetical protein